MAARMMTSGGGCQYSEDSYTEQIAAKLTGVLLLLSEKLVDLLANLTLGELDVVLGGTIIVHKREEAIVGDIELKLRD